jgi:glycosyltransferase involved in cell wall biosynthesis
MTSPLVSIVLPVFNGARFLSAAIESVLAQTYVKWELSVVDDASIDATPSLIREFEQRDRRITSLRNPANRKLPGSLNAGFARARGELLTWTSHDNCYRPAGLDRMVEFLQGRPEVGLVYTDWSCIDDEDRPLGSDVPRGPQMLAFENPIGACFLYRRRVYEDIGDYDERLFLVEDYDYWVRVSCRFRIARLPEDLYRYRHHGGSLTANRTQAVGAALEEMLLQHLPRMPWLTRAQRSLSYLELARRARWGGRNENLRRSLWLALHESPLVVSRRWRQQVADRMTGSFDPTLLSSHRAILQRVVTCDEGVTVLAAYASGSNTLVRWTYRLRNLWALPRIAVEKLLSFSRNSTPKL